VTDIREELMPRSKCLFCPAAFVAALVVVISAHASALAQDASKVAADATRNIKDIQKKLAAGKTADDKDNANLKRLRVDGFTAAGDKVKVTGVFIDPGTKPNGDVESQVGDAAKDLILKHLGVTEKVGFAWDGVKSVGVLDDMSQPKGELAPHIALQTAANAAGGKGKREDKRAADRMLLTDSTFGAGGEVVLSGFRDDDPDVETWLTDEGTKALASHPAAVRAKDDKPQVSFALITKIKPWALTVPKVQEVMAGSNEAVFRRVRADRVYFNYQGADPKLNVAGVRIGEDKFVDTTLQNSLRQMWPEVLGGTKPIRIALAPEIVSGLVEPVADLRAGVSAERVLDGVRVDPGAEFDAAGGFAPSGLRPDLTEAQRDKLNETFQAVLKPLRTKGDAAAPRYELLAASKVGIGRMKRIPIGELRDELTAWAVKSKDDVRIRRLHFKDDLKPLAQKHYTVAKDGGGLVLVYQVADPNDLKAVEVKFNELFDRYFKDGIPEVKVPGATSAMADPVPDPKDKEALLPGLTAELRRIMAADQKKWYGVLIARGYFDKDDKYTLTGVVDKKEQNAQLADLLAELKKNPKWVDYFSPEPNAPALQVISMTEMLDRLKRVTPAYPTLDRMRVETARYDDRGNLAIEAHIVESMDPDAPGLLAKLLRNHPTYKHRAPEDKLVRIVKAKGPPDWDVLVGHFSLGYGAQLLAKGEMEKAKEWLDVGTLHYPNISAVWFLSAYYHHLKNDPELVARDLKRVIDLENPLEFNGPWQRKQRYANAKDLQGPKRVALEDAWLIRYREVKDGAPPLVMEKK
jgi:hypothetical protein